MKKVFAAVSIGIFAVAMASCGGHGGGCEAYKKSDYTKYKAEKQQEIEMTKKDTKK